ncbi:hypothetical protein N2152v2_004473 [Parachlorella kessleri]
MHLSLHSQREAGVVALIPLASRLAVTPLRNAPAEPPDVETQDIAETIQFAAFAFLGRMLLYSDTEQRQRALEAEPRLLDVAVAATRKGRLEPDGCGSPLQAAGSTIWLLTAFLESPQHRSLAAGALVETVMQEIAPGKRDPVVGKVLFAVQRLVSKDSGLTSHVNRLVDQGYHDQEMVARLGPKAVRAAPLQACAVLEMFHGIARHIQSSLPFYTLVEAGVLLTLVRAAEKLIDSEEALTFYEGSKMDLSADNMIYCMHFIIPAAITHRIINLPAEAAARGDQPLQDAWMLKLRGTLLPRLRKFLFHPDLMTRCVMIPLLGLLGCLEAQPVSNPARRDQLANSPTNVSPSGHREGSSLRSVQRELRVLARLMDPDSTMPVPSSKLAVTEFSAFDEVYPVLGPAELRICDGCGLYDHFRCITKAAPLKLMACSGCKQRRYCNTQCQRYHWKAHKTCCKAQAAAAAAAAESSNGRAADAAGNTARAATSADFASWSVRQLKQHLTARGVDLTGCVEKEQLVELCKAHP